MVYLKKLFYKKKNSHKNCVFLRKFNLLEDIKKNFTFINNYDGIYADSASKTAIPNQVQQAIKNFQNKSNASYYKAGNSFIVEGTEILEQSRLNLAKFLGSRSSGEIIWTNGVPDALNLFLKSYHPKKNSKINILFDKNLSLPWILPWLNPKANSNNETLFFSMSESNHDYINDLNEEISTHKPKLVVFPHISQISGQLYPIEEIIKISHDNSAEVLLNMTHSLSHVEIDVHKLNIDYAIGKFDTNFGPSGIGFMYGKYALIDEMYPDDFNEYAITEIDNLSDLKNFSSTYKFKKPPERFESLSQNYSGIIGASEALNFINAIGIQKIREHEMNLSKKFIQEIQNLNIDDLNMFKAFSIENQIPIFSLASEMINPHDLSLMLDSNYKIASHSGFLSTPHFFNSIGYKDGVNQFSFSIYNSLEEIETISTSLNEIFVLFK